MEELLDIAQRLPLVFWAAFGVGLAYFLAAKWDKCRHLRFVWQASRELRRLSKLKEPWKKYEFLREVNPFVFEEMILTAFKRKGWPIKRNKRYTGDGGIDGMVRFKGQWCAIQAKRYKGYINARDVAELSRICRHRSVKGGWSPTERKHPLSSKRLIIHKFSDTRKNTKNVSFISFNAIL